MSMADEVTEAGRVAMQHLDEAVARADAQARADVWHLAECAGVAVVLIALVIAHAWRRLTW